MQAYKSVSAMKGLVSEQPECALLLAEIFKGNFEICRRAPWAKPWTQKVTETLRSFCEENVISCG